MTTALSILAAVAVFAVLVSSERRVDAAFESSRALRFAWCVLLLNGIALVVLTFIVGPSAWRLMLWPFVKGD